MNDIRIIFREIDGLWVAVDSACQTPPILTDTLAGLDITIDENTRFCRKIRYKNNVKQTIEYRANGGKIRLNILYNKT